MTLRARIAADRVARVMDIAPIVVKEKDAAGWAKAKRIQVPNSHARFLLSSTLQSTPL